MGESSIPCRDDYKVFYPINTRWSDNDIYGHVNNVNYYSYFDTIANNFLISEGGLAAFALQLSSEEGRATLALHMLMSSVDEAVDLPLLSGEVEVLKPLKLQSGDHPHIKLVPS